MQYCQAESTWKLAASLYPLPRSATVCTLVGTNREEVRSEFTSDDVNAALRHTTGQCHDTAPSFASGEIVSCFFSPRVSAHQRKRRT